MGAIVRMMIDKINQMQRNAYLERAIIAHRPRRSVDLNHSLYFLGRPKIWGLGSQK